MAGRGSKMQWCEAFLVQLVDVGSAFNQFVHHHVLPIVAGHVEGCVAVRIGLIDLDNRDETMFPHQKQKLDSAFLLESNNFNRG